MNFSRHYAASAVCTPSRYNYLTGRFAGHCDSNKFLNEFPKGGEYKNFTAGKNYNLINNDVDSFLNSVDKMLEATWYMAESVPYFTPDLGPDQIAAFLGSEIYSSEDSKNTSWVKHIIENKDAWDDFLPLKFDPDNIWLKQHREICEKTAVHAKEKYVVGVADLHTNADALSALRSPAGLCMDLFDCPDKINNAMHDIRKLYSRFFESLNTASGINEETGFISWIPFWSEKPYAVIQCGNGRKFFRKYRKRGRKYRSVT